jgi:hypothetical protein
MLLLTIHSVMYGRYDFENRVPGTGARFRTAKFGAGGTGGLRATPPAIASA